MGAHLAPLQVLGHQHLAQVVGKELTATAVGKDKAIVLNILCPKVMAGHLLQEWRVVHICCLMSSKIIS